MAGDRDQLAALGRGAERDRHACFLGPPGPANTVNIQLRRLRQVKIDHQIQAGDINPPCRNISGHQHLQFTALELAQNLCPDHLAHIAMQHVNRITLSHQKRR